MTPQNHPLCTGGAGLYWPRYEALFSCLNFQRKGKFQVTCNFSTSTPRAVGKVDAVLMPLLPSLRSAWVQTVLLILKLKHTCYLCLPASLLEVALGYSAGPKKKNWCLLQRQALLQKKRKKRKQEGSENGVGGGVLLFLFSQTCSYSTEQVGLEFAILLPWPSEYWNDRRMPSHPAFMKVEVF